MFSNILDVSWRILLCLRGDCVISPDSILTMHYYKKFPDTFHIKKNIHCTSTDLKFILSREMLLPNRFFNYKIIHKRIFYSKKNDRISWWNSNIFNIILAFLSRVIQDIRDGKSNLYNILYRIWLKSFLLFGTEKSDAWSFPHMGIRTPRVHSPVEYSLEEIKDRWRTHWRKIHSPLESR